MFQVEIVQLEISWNGRLKKERGEEYPIYYIYIYIYSI